MSTLPYNELSEVILEFARRPRSVLFTGAGVGKKVGLPLWDEYLGYLADVCSKHGDSNSADLIRRKVKTQNFLGAASIYEDCEEIPAGERLKLLAAPFLVTIAKEDLEILGRFFWLPFEAIVTTNYDRSQHDAFALVNQRAPVQVELEGSSMRGAASQTSFFIARIHGSAEVPSSIVLSKSGYANLAKNKVYEDFLLNLLQTRPCLFVGFSFVDPSIDNVLKTFKEKAGGAYKTQHLALLPVGSESLKVRLSELNIKVHFYDPSDEHKDLWKAFRKADADFQKMTAIDASVESKDGPKFPEHPAFLRFLSFTYAQVKLSVEARPVLEQARDGVVLSLIRESGETGAKREDLLAGLQKVLSLDENEAGKVLQDSITRLFSDQDIRVDGEIYSVLKDEGNFFDDSMKTLLESVSDRLRVREGITCGQQDKRDIAASLEQILIVRSWDLAAHYAGGGAGYGQDLRFVIRRIIADIVKGSDQKKLALENCISDVLMAPTDEESSHLAELSRAAFSLQLVLSSPRQSLLQSHFLPHRVYFDASVLLPAIVPGHPLRNLYLQAISGLQKASKAGGVVCELCVGEPFLNEVIAHREKAIECARSLNLTRDRLAAITQLSGADNTNVFIGAYATFLATSKGDEWTFDKFLRINAPYKSEADLLVFMKERGFSVIPMDFTREKNQEFRTVLNNLLQAYENLTDELVRGKERILVEHEAAQLVQIDLDHSEGLRAIFVTNDRKLRRAANSRGETRVSAGYMVPPEGFVGLVDIMAGMEVDQRALTRLIWASPRREADLAIRDYLIKLALAQQDVAYAKAAPQVIDEIVAKKREVIKAQEISFSDTSIDSVVANARFMDRVESEFYAKMKRAIERQEGGI